MAYKEKSGANRGAASPADRKISGRNTGTHDFSGQQERDMAKGETPKKEARKEHVGHGIRYETQHNGHNGSSTKRKIISSNSHELHGGRVNQKEGGVP